MEKVLMDMEEYQFKSGRMLYGLIMFAIKVALL
jgi:hypothetical protein